MAELIRRHDWASTPLGPICDWPTELVSSVNMMLSSKVVTTLFWGSDLLMIYNDLYRPHLGAKHPALGQTLKQAWSEVYDQVGPVFTGPIQTGEATHVDQVSMQVLFNGEMVERVYTMSINPVWGETDEGFRVLGLYQTAIDHTETVQSARKLRASEAQASRVLESIGDAVIVTDASLNVTRMNEIAEKFTGWREREAQGLSLQTVFRIVNGTTRAAVENPAEKVVRLGTIVGLAIHTVLIAKDGTETPIDDSAAPIRNDDGQLTGVVLVFRDITERRTAERERDVLLQQVQSNYAELEAIYNSVDLGLGLLDAEDLRYVRVNERLAAMFTRPANEVIGISIFEFAPDVAGLKATLDRVVAGESVTGLQLEGELATSPGEHRYWTVDYLPIRAADGRVVAISSAVVEVTEDRKRTAALLQTEKLAAVGRLAASIAHEINNPLQSVTNLLYLARTSKSFEEVQSYLDTTERELRRVSVISNQTLRFYKQSSKPSEATCLDLFSSVLDIYQGRLVNSRVEVQKRKRAQRSVECFDGEIRQVLNNLVGNAIDAMHPEGGRLVLRSRDGHNWKSGKKGLVLTVADTGTGMSPAVLKKVFDAFYTTKGIGGTGLGLWVSSEIVARHHGELRVRSSQQERHRGTVFSLFLPFDAVQR